MTNSTPSNKAIPFLVIGLIVASFILGSLYTKIKMYESGAVAKVGTTGTGGTDQPPAQPPAAEQPAIVDVALDDDPVLGDKNAPVTLIEFSDYECPFCKRHFDETYPSIKSKYIDTGKVKMIFRDLPLSFHDPMATKEAVAANCARVQGGDGAYYKFHDEIFKRTTSNGNGLNDEAIQKIAADLQLNTSLFTACLSDAAQKKEVTDDLAYASTVGADATPTFFVGKSTGQTIKGERLVGAYPLTSFETLIEKYLSQ